MTDTCIRLGPKYNITHCIPQYIDKQKTTPHNTRISNQHITQYNVLRNNSDIMKAV